MKNIRLLDCTLRDGAYIVNSIFGEETIKGIIDGLVLAGVEIIECGWLKNDEPIIGSSFFHIKDDIKPYLKEKKKNVEYCVMIDWNRYDTKYLDANDGDTFDTVRVVFPYDRINEGLEIGKAIQDKGYNISFQLSNALSYNDDDLKKLAIRLNDVSPRCVCIADTFGAMYDEDVVRIASILHDNLNNDIMIGMHTHNNMQLAFSNIICFVRYFKDINREIVVDSSLYGMGRGAGNAATELLCDYLNKKYDKNYRLDIIAELLDKYMSDFHDKYDWGYTITNSMAGMYGSHINNVNYLKEKHNISALKLKKTLESMAIKDRWKYDYDLLEKKYQDATK